MVDRVCNIAQILEEFFKGLYECGLISNYIIQLQLHTYESKDIDLKYGDLIGRLIMQLQHQLSNTVADLNHEEKDEGKVVFTCSTTKLSDLTDSYILQSSSIDLNVDNTEESGQGQDDTNANTNTFTEIILNNESSSPPIDTSIGNSELKSYIKVDKSGHLSQIIRVNESVKELNLDNVVQVVVDTTIDEPNTNCISDDCKSREASENELKCTECGLCFKSPADVKKHLHTSHFLQKVKLQNEQTCNICNKVFASTVSLQEHFRSDHPETGCFSCHTCGKRLTTRISLTRHQDTHIGSRDAVCKFCGKVFSRADYLRTHYASHIGKRNFACSHCPSRFNLKIKLKIHEKIHTGVKDHVCEECGKGFVRKDKLKEHTLRHLKIKRFPCHVCSKQYAEARDLNKHLKSHAPSVL